MIYFKYVLYLYLVVAGFFIYSGIMSLTEKDNAAAYVSFALGGAAVFMFFFRRNFQKKFPQGNNKK